MAAQRHKAHGKLFKMRQYPRRKTIFFDVDDTLKLKSGLNTKLVEWCRTQIDDGYELVLWSARGKQYATDYAKRHGIADMFQDIVSKPGYIVDDQGWTWIKYTKRV